MQSAKQSDSEAEPPFLIKSGFIPSKSAVSIQNNPAIGSSDDSWIWAESETTDWISCGAVLSDHGWNTTKPPVHQSTVHQTNGGWWTVAGGQHLGWWTGEGGRCTMVFIVDCGRPLCRSLLRILFYKMLQFGRKIEWLSGGWWPVNRNFGGGLVHRGRWTKIIWLSGWRWPLDNHFRCGRSTGDRWSALVPISVAEPLFARCVNFLKILLKLRLIALRNSWKTLAQLILHCLEITQA